MSPASGAAVLITATQGWTLNTVMEKARNNVLGDTWISNLQGLKGWSGSFSGFLDTAQATLFTAATGTAVANIYLYPSRATTANYYYGTCWPVLSGVGGSTTSIVAFTCNFDGDGQLATN